MCEKFFWFCLNIYVFIDFRTRAAPEWDCVMSNNWCYCDAGGGVVMIIMMLVMPVAWVNAFNALNSRLLFHIAEKKSFPHNWRKCFVTKFAHLYLSFSFSPFFHLSFLHYIYTSPVLICLANFRYIFFSMIPGLMLFFTRFNEFMKIVWMLHSYTCQNEGDASIKFKEKFSNW